MSKSKTKSMTREEVNRMIRGWKKYAKPLPKEWDKIFTEKQKDFLQAIRVSRGVVSVACDMACVSYQSVSNWRKDEVAFRNAFSEQVQAGIDDVEFRHLIAADDDVISRIHVLKCKRPEVWNEDARVRLDVNESKVIKVELPQAAQAKMLAEVFVEMHQLMTGGTAMLVDMTKAQSEKPILDALVTDATAPAENSMPETKPETEEAIKDEEAKTT